MLQEILGIIAGIIAFSAYIIYYYAILKGETKPSRATWWIWTVVGTIIGLSYFFSGATYTIWVPLGEALGPLGVAILSVKYGVGGWTPFDRWCILGASISLAIWFASGSALLALLSSLCIDLSAALPTIKKIRKDPSTEDKFAWSLTSLANFMNMGAVNTITFAVLIYPIYAAIIDLVILFYIWRRK